jgi:hypothetical protein
MRWLLSFLLLGFWGACVHALSSSGTRLLVVLEEDKSLYSTFWADLKGTFYMACHPAEYKMLIRLAFTQRAVIQ